MYVVREVLHCRPGNVAPMLEKFRALASALREIGHEPPRLLTDVAGERFWTLVAEMTVETIDDFLALERAAMANESARHAMAGYHDLVAHGRREIFQVAS
jgi:hypothetical protein